MKKLSSVFAGGRLGVCAFVCVFLSVCCVHAASTCMASAGTCVSLLLFLCVFHCGDSAVEFVPAFPCTCTDV